MKAKIKKSIKRLKNKLKRAIDWYIIGEYHCDECPYCWQEWSYEGDGDAGCYIKGDLEEPCRLFPPFIHLFGYFKKKRALYHFNHEYDGFAEFMEEQDRKERTLANLLDEYIFEKNELYVKKYNGEYVPVGETHDHNFGHNTHLAVMNIIDEYESVIHPIEHKKLSQKWKELIKETIDSFTAKFKPYFCD